MDYFYAGSTFGNKGLADIYIKSKYKATGKLQLSAELHHFSSASAVKDIDGAALSRQFGMEADLVAGYSLTSIISLEAGYSHFFSTATLSSVEVKHVDNAQKNNNWAYLMVRIQPEIFFK